MGKVYALAARFFQHGGKQAHLELESQYIHARSAALAAFGDDLFDQQPTHGQIDRPDHHQPPVARAVEKAIRRLRAFVAAKARGLVGAQDQFAEFILFLREACSFCVPVKRPPTFR